MDGFWLLAGYCCPAVGLLDKWASWSILWQHQKHRLYLEEIQSISEMRKMKKKLDFSPLFFILLSFNIPICTGSRTYSNQRLSIKISKLQNSVPLLPIFLTLEHFAKVHSFIQTGHRKLYPDFEESAKFSEGIQALRSGHCWRPNTVGHCLSKRMGSAGQVSYP